MNQEPDPEAGSAQQEDSSEAGPPPQQPARGAGSPVKAPDDANDAKRQQHRQAGRQYMERELERAASRSRPPRETAAAKKTRQDLQEFGEAFRCAPFGLLPAALAPVSMHACCKPAAHAAACALPTHPQQGQSHHLHGPLHGSQLPAPAAGQGALQGGKRARVRADAHRARITPLLSPPVQGSLGTMRAPAVLLSLHCGAAALGLWLASAYGEMFNLEITVNAAKGAAVPAALTGMQARGSTHLQCCTLPHVLAPRTAFAQHRVRSAPYTHAAAARPAVALLLQRAAPHLGAVCGVLDAGGGGGGRCSGGPAPGGAGAERGDAHAPGRSPWSRR